jgi:hypothetical protein
VNRILASDAQSVKRSFQLIGLLIVFACSSFGSTITYTDITTASGTIGSTSFTSAPITISAVGDTANRQSISQGFFIDNSSASVTIGGLGTFLFTTGTRFFVNNLSSTPGFSRAGSLGADLIDGPSNSAFSSWDMLTSIGPITGVGGILQWTLSPVLTSGGTLVLDNASAGITFSAQVSSTTPEPGTVGLLGTGIIAAAGFVRRKLML